MNSNREVSVLCARAFQPKALALLQSVSPRLNIRQVVARNREEVAEVISSDTEILYSSFAPADTASLLSLRWFQCRSAGMNALVDSSLWKREQITITSASGIHACSIAEYTVGMVIAMARNFLGYVSLQKKAEWPVSPLNNAERFPGRELRGSTVLIVGYGSIGREVARLCKAFGMHVIAVKRSPDKLADDGFRLEGTGDPNGSIPEKVIGPEQLDTVLPHAEFIILTAAATPENHHQFGEEQFCQMRSDAVLINAARGDLIDEQAFAQALYERKIRGAALDVFGTEPLPKSSPLWRLENLIISPHVAGITPRYDENMALLFAENLSRYLNGKPLLNKVNRQLGY